MDRLGNGSLGQWFTGSMVGLVKGSLGQRFDKGASPSPPDRPHTSQLDQQLPESVTHARTHVIIRHVIESHVPGRRPDNLINNCLNPVMRTRQHVIPHARHAHAHARHRHAHARHRHAHARHASCTSCARARASSSMSTLPFRYPLPCRYLLSSRERVTRHARSPVRLTSCPHPRSTHVMHRGGHQSSPCTHADTRHHHTHTHTDRE